MERVIGGVQNHFVPRTPEWVMAGVMFLDGVVLLLPGNTLTSTRAYAPLRLLGSENEWGSIAVTIGIGWCVALFLNGTFTWFRRVSPWARASFCLSTCLYMALFASGMRIGNPYGDGYLMHGGWAVMAAVYCAIIAREVRFVDKEATRWRHLRQSMQQRRGTGTK